MAQILPFEGQLPRIDPTAYIANPQSLSAK